MKNNKINYSPVIYPFAIYKDTNRESMGATQECIIHLNTLSQMCYQAYRSYEQAKIPKFIVLDKFAINGVGEPGIYQFCFESEVVKKVDNIDAILFIPSFDFRIGVIHEYDSETELIISVSDLKRMIRLHGDLTDHIDYQDKNSKESAIQWILCKGSDDE